MGIEEKLPTPTIKHRLRDREVSACVRAKAPNIAPRSSSANQGVFNALDQHASAHSTNLHPTSDLPNIVRCLFHQIMTYRQNLHAAEPSIASHKQHAPTREVATPRCRTAGPVKRLFSPLVEPTERLRRRWQ